MIGETMGSMNGQARGKIKGEVTGETIGDITEVSGSNPYINSLIGSKASGLSGVRVDGLMKQTVLSSDAIANW
jgi:hypothetical protein